MTPDSPLDIRRLKIWAQKNLPRDSKLKEIIMLDEDRMLPEAFLAKVFIWLTLYDIEHGPQDEKKTRKR